MDSKCCELLAEKYETRWGQLEMSNRNSMGIVKLNNGICMPKEGYGVFQIKDLDICERCVLDAMDAGYRLFDTAAAYLNEEAVGRAIQKSISAGMIKREELFITTKIWIQDYGTQNTRRAFRESMERLGLSYLDLLLLHQPFGNWQEAWRTLESLYLEGKVRAIGVSNFTISKLGELLTQAKIKPMINQIELHPFYLQEEALAQMRRFQIQPEAWGPLCEGQKGIFTNPLLRSIGEKYGKTAAQVSLRWNIQRGVVVIPKSVHKDRMVENIDVWNFTLSQQDMLAIAALDVGCSEIIDFESPATERLLLRWKLHE